MNNKNISKSTMKRLPIYLHYLNKLSNEDSTYISSTRIAKDLKLGEVLVRKDLALVSGEGKPKLGYIKSELEERLREVLNTSKITNAIIIGAGKLGQALQYYDGFEEIGIKIIASFDNDITKIDNQNILNIKDLDQFCNEHDVEIGIITVSEQNAQLVSDALIKNNINKIWNFSSVNLNVPYNVSVKNENLAASLAVLSIK